jgi:hypothetical protein
MDTYQRAQAHFSQTRLALGYIITLGREPCATGSSPLFLPHWLPITLDFASFLSFVTPHFYDHTLSSVKGGARLPTPHHNAPRFGLCVLYTRSRHVTHHNLPAPLQILLSTFPSFLSEVSHLACCFVLLACSLGIALFPGPPKSHRLFHQIQDHHNHAQSSWRGL